MKKLDKKQIPQFAALCVLSAGLFGYFVLRLVTPSPAAAGTRPAPAVAKPVPASAARPADDKKGALLPDTAAEGDEAPVPAPTPGMHDPFVIGYVDPKTLPGSHGTPAPPVPGKPPVQVASLHAAMPAFPSAPVLPAAPMGLKGFPVQPLPSSTGLPMAAPMTSLVPAPPAAPAPPTWTVTGVLQSEEGQVAILRSGAARRIVHTGDFVDSVYRVVDVTRSDVVLRHGAAIYHLRLGAIQEKPSKATPVFKKPAPATMPALPPAMAQLPINFSTAEQAGKPIDLNF